MKTKKLMMVALVSSTLALSGCGAMSTAIKKRNLEVKTQMSETIWISRNDIAEAFGINLRRASFIITYISRRKEKISFRISSYRRCAMTFLC